jgi:A/G-specific adenine glycosylase
MEIGALICKPSNPKCFECPISKSCKSYKKNDFEIKSKNRFNKIKYFEAEIYENQNKYLLIRNNKFKFLKNLLIFPMKEVEKFFFNTSLNKKINVKMSNMDMKIILNKKNKLIKIKNGYLLDKKNIKGQIIPSFTKKIFNSISNYS